MLPALRANRERKKNYFNGGGADGEEWEEMYREKKIPSQQISFGGDFTLKAGKKKIIPLLLIEVNKVQQILTQIWLQWD